MWPFTLISTWSHIINNLIKLICYSFFMNKKTKVVIAVAGGVFLLVGTAWVASANLSAACNKTAPGWMAVAPLSGDVFVPNSENSAWSKMAHLPGISDRDCSKP